MKATGVTPSALQENVRQSYKTLRSFPRPPVTISLSKTDNTNRMVTVSGEVKQERLITFQEGMRLVSVISAAGGFTDFANKKKVRIMQGNRTTEYDLRRMAEKPAMNPLVQPNDQVIVPHR